MTTAQTPGVTLHYRLRGDHSWQNDAVCRATDYNPIDPEWFFPGPEETVKIRAARALCAQCPVRRLCLEGALETGDTYGIRGGMTEEEREPLHAEAARRLDEGRVTAVLAGHDVHLNRAERRAVVAIAYEQGVSEEHLSRLLKVSEEHVQKLYRKARRASRSRAAKVVTEVARLAYEPSDRGDFGPVA